jgi:phage-related protein
MDSKAKFTWIKRVDGTSEFEDYLDSLSEKDGAKLSALIDKIEDNGLELAKRLNWVKKLRGDICEIRSKQGSDIQRALYFQKLGNQYVITHGFSKKSAKTPESEIVHAENMMAKYLRAKKYE